MGACSGPEGVRHTSQTTPGVIRVVLCVSADKGIPPYSFSPQFWDPQPRKYLSTAVRWQFKKSPSPFLTLTCRVFIGESLFVPSFNKYLIRSPICQKVDCLSFLISKSNFQGTQSVCGTSSLQKRIPSTHLNLKKDLKQIFTASKKERKVPVK